MPNEQANAATIGGLTFSVLGPLALGQPILFLCVPAILLARGVRALLDKKQEKTENNKKEDKEMLPSRYSMLPRVLDGDYEFDHPFLNRYLAPKNPLTELAEQSPRLAYNAIVAGSLAKTHENIATEPAREFAKQGRGIFAETFRRKGLLTDSDSIVTVIRPI
jgi:hypothetical protein